VSDSQKINPEYLRELKEYAVLKELVFNSSNKSLMVDIELLLSLIDQANLRFKMFLIQIKLGNIEIGKDEDAIYADILYELVKTEPSSIES
jgi:hypothetical protein